MRRLALSPIMVAGRKVFGFAWNGVRLQPLWCSAYNATVFGFDKNGVRLRLEYACDRHIATNFLFFDLPAGIITGSRATAGK
jgi:hypothetical protein